MKTYFYKKKYIILEEHQKLKCLISLLKDYTQRTEMTMFLYTTIHLCLLRYAKTASDFTLLLFCQQSHPVNVLSFPMSSLPRLCFALSVFTCCQYSVNSSGFLIVSSMPAFLPCLPVIRLSIHLCTKSLLTCYSTSVLCSSIYSRLLLHHISFV